MITDKLIKQPIPVEKRAIVVLAAGASTRMGSPKQLLPYKGKTLLQYVIDTAKAAEVALVVTVLGANEEVILEKIGAGIGLFVVNADWRDGMASSIQTGLQKALEMLPGVEAIAFLVGDQPFLSSTVINGLFGLLETTGAPVAACSYKGTAGVPAAFRKTVFPELMKLKGAEGAKKLIKAAGVRAALLDFQNGATDIDTEADYNALLNGQEQS
ncbi:MAG: nucleotidyltransferase family protein [Chitinophagaceae bacterium]